MNTIGPALPASVLDAQRADAPGTPRALEQRLLAMIDTQRGQGPDGEEEAPDPGEAMDAFVRRWFTDDFLRAMMLGDEEKLGVQPEEWT